MCTPGPHVQKANEIFLQRSGQIGLLLDHMLDRAMTGRGNDLYLSRWGRFDTNYKPVLDSNASDTSNFQAHTQKFRHLKSARQCPLITLCSAEQGGGGGGAESALRTISRLNMRSSSHTFEKNLSRVSTKQWMTSRMQSSFCNQQTLSHQANQASVTVLLASNPCMKLKRPVIDE